MPSKQQTTTPSRRSVLLAGLSLGLPPLGQTEGFAVQPTHGGAGTVSPPAPMPRLAVVLENGHRTDLDRLSRGRVTALQFVLTGCSSICPVLGAIFSRVQAELSGVEGIQLVSLSLDPAHDTPDSFAAWLRNFGAGDTWHGVIPQTDGAGVAALLQGWGLGSGTSAAFHTDTVALVDHDARMVFRFPDLPDPKGVSEMMRRLSLT